MSTEIVLPEGWYRVQQMGRKTYYGHVTPYALGAVVMLRVTCPAIEGTPATSERAGAEPLEQEVHHIPSGSLYGLTETTEAEALAMRADQRGYLRRLRVERPALTGGGIEEAEEILCDDADTYEEIVDGNERPW